MSALNGLHELVQLVYLFICTKGCSSALIEFDAIAYHSFSAIFLRRSSHRPMNRPQSSGRTFATRSESRSSWVVSKAIRQTDKLRPMLTIQRSGMLIWVTAWVRTKWAGFSTFRCALNSALMYSSPKRRISAGRCLRCARRSRL